MPPTKQQTEGSIKRSDISDITLDSDVAGSQPDEVALKNFGCNVQGYTVGREWDGLMGLYAVCKSQPKRNGRPLFIKTNNLGKGVELGLELGGSRLLVETLYP